MITYMATPVEVDKQCNNVSVTLLSGNKCVHFFVRARHHWASAQELHQQDCGSEGEFLTLGDGYLVLKVNRSTVLD